MAYFCEYAFSDAKVCLVCWKQTNPFKNSGPKIVLISNGVKRNVVKKF